ncbi:hypothetical protein BJX99DRAFT_257115 [Aspergillus californicus]
MVTLETLPTEILHQIISYLCDHCQGRIYLRGLTQTSLVPLSLVSKACRRLRDIAQPILFHFFFHHRAGYQDRLVSFLHTLTSRPDLARAVSILQFHSYGENLTEKDRALVETCVANVGLPSLAPEWHIDGRQRQILMEVAIACCPNLEALSFGTSPDWTTDIFLSLSISLPTRIIFKRLYHLSVGSARQDVDSSGTVPYDQVAALLRAAPNLRQLYLSGIRSLSSSGTGFPNLDNLKILNLGSGVYSPFFLHFTLAACPRLQSFSLHLELSDYMGASITDIWIALQQVKDTLQEITVEVNRDIPFQLQAHDHRLSSLQQFTALRTLEISSCIWYGIHQTWTQQKGYYNMDQFVAELLPTTLEKLVIRNTGPPVPAGLMALALCVPRGAYPWLKTVEVVISDDFSADEGSESEWEDMVTTLREEFLKVGVSFSMDFYVNPGFMLFD